MVEAVKRSELTALQRQGLERLEACAREGLTIRAFARRRRLSEQSLYQVAKVLRRKGVLPPVSRGGSKPSPRRRKAAPKPRFVQVQAAETTTPEPAAVWRAQFPNGVVLEGSSDLARVVEALAKL
jgi:hypothetical protein